MKKLLLISALLAVGALVGCNYKVNKLSDDDGTGVVFENDKLDFATVMTKVIVPKCFKCHSSTEEVKDGVAFDSYAQVIENLADIKADIEDGSMPKRSAPLTVAQKNLILAWINAGAPEFETATQPESPPPVSTIPEPALDYATVNSQVIMPLCFKCHQAPRDQGDVNLESYQEVLKNIVEIKETIEDGSMPRKRKMTSEQKNLILNWIAAGAPEKAMVDSEAQGDRESMTSSLVQFLFTQKGQNSNKEQ